ncbi:sodium:solute symporter family protein [Stieleria sp. ICT_E10.1]|uniref:sodium:solute symporter family protein n=1 Tax=Stieleria sedimenti TaxID=2976331 RepID=UPI002180399F|nr:sodium:solute symporter family protein [Stieleria sedimenti]MCS7465703.1 sodium:solute symporter family protein [Stieleria sedimenti]
MTWIDYVVVAVYFIVMIAIGLWAMGRVKGQEDYFMGGRGFGKLLQTFAAFGAGTGAHEPIQVGRTGWTSGLSGVWSALMWLFVTPVYWITAVWYRRMRHLTLGDWFVERYESKALGAAYAVFAIIFYMFYLSTMLSAIAKFAVPLMGLDEIAGLDLKYVLIPGLAGIVIVYGVLGGLTAAYWTDLIQGIFIILLSVLLIPYGLWALVKEFGDPSTQGVMDGFTIMHQRVSSDYFSLFAGPSAGEFPLQYIVALTLLALVGIVVQPHFIATGGGSAKSENEARIGLVVGNFLKRLCTVGWAITALIALALLASRPELAVDPDLVWGIAAREILGPLNLGLVGLMLACLMAAMMSSADTYMIVSSALITRNLYAAYVNPSATDRESVKVARVTGLAIIVGASIVAITMADVFAQFTFAIELPILFAAPFWIGMYWRRANGTAVWITIAFSALFFFILPLVIPMLSPEMRTDPAWTTTTNRIVKSIKRTATPADVARHEAWVEAMEQAKDDETVRQKLGAEPQRCEVGDPIEVILISGDKSIFWSGGVKPVGEESLQMISTVQDGPTSILTQRRTGELQGEGQLKLDFVLYHYIGVDLANVSKATLETLRLPTRVLLPFLVLIVASFLTPRTSESVLDRYYAKMKTEVDPDPETDRRNLEESYSNPKRFEDRRLFPGTDIEALRPRKSDVYGFAISVAVCFVVIALLVWLAGIGSVG